MNTERAQQILDMVTTNNRGGLENARADALDALQQEASIYFDRADAWIDRAYDDADDDALAHAADAWDAAERAGSLVAELLIEFSATDLDATPPDTLALDAIALQVIADHFQDARLRPTAG